MFRLIYLCLLAVSLCCAGQTAKDKDLTDYWQERLPWMIAHSLAQPGQAPEYLNRLIKEDSPYLLSHAMQPVNWYAWGDTPLSLAKSSGQLIYLSIGYETCHWCHVLAEESYADKTFAGILNDNFISIKVDRERYPELDKKYHRALENMTGNAGWPIQVVLTPSGHIVWISSYMQKAELSTILTTLGKKWQTNSAAIERFALAQNRQLLPPIPTTSAPLSRRAYATKFEVSLSQLKTVLKTEQNGQGPRFLRADWLLILLDEYLRTNEPQNLALVEKQVYQLLTSPSYDFIDGGMHRYAEDGHWRQPHFEKMLYDQAQLIRVLARLYLITSKPAYLEFAQQVVNFVTQKLHFDKVFTSSLSALSGGKEGAYYFTQQHGSLPNDIGLYSGFEGRLLYLTKLSLANNKVLTELRQKRQRVTAPQQDSKGILAWNSLYILSLIELAQASSDRELLRTIPALLNQLISSFYPENALYRISFEKKPSIAATVEDYAWFILLLQQAHWSLNDSSYLSLIKQISPQFMQLIHQTEWQDLLLDTQLASPAAVSLMALQQLSMFNDAKKYRGILTELKSKLNVASLEINAISSITAWNTGALWSAKSLQPFGRGNGVANINYIDGQAVVNIRLKAGWHVNSHQPLDASLIPTNITLAQRDQEISIHYPQPLEKRLGFSKQLLSLYEGEIQIPLSSDFSSSQSRLLTLTVQTCSDTLCLLPEDLQLLVPPSSK